MPTSQDQIFADFEGDRWFARNNPRPEKFDPATDPVCRLIDLYHLKPRNVIEVGAANGVRLEAIRQRYHSRVWGIDVSSKALADGKSRFPQIQFIRGAAHAIPTIQSFDLVIINFVFHWIDRSNLLRSIAEVDRIVMAGGLLIIGDFYPSNFIKVRYHHLPDRKVYTYKQNYAEIFAASGLYSHVALLTGTHASGGLESETSEDHRTGAWLLRKTLDEGYIERTSRRELPIPPPPGRKPSVGRSRRRP